MRKAEARDQRFLAASWGARSDWASLSDTDRARAWLGLQRAAKGLHTLLKAWFPLP